MAAKSGQGFVIVGAKPIICMTALLLGSQIVLAADQAPKFDTAPSCRAAAATAVSKTRDAAACERDEQAARATLEQKWSQFSAAQRAECVRLSTLGGSPSYVELLTCLEMAKGASEIPAGESMGPGDKVEKSRHAK
jgi:hypothetical protein